MTRVAIVVFERVDLLDVGGPYEVLLTASRLVLRDGGSPPFDVVTVGPGPVQAYGGLTLVPQATFDTVGEVDIIVVPGAVDIAGVKEDGALMDAVGRLARRTPTVASVCTGAFLLADLGLLPPTWTTHWEDVEELQSISGTPGDASVRWVDSGTVVTGGGLSSGMAMSLHLVERFAGAELARRTARQIDYEWDPTGARALLGPE